MLKPVWCAIVGKNYGVLHLDERAKLRVVVGQVETARLKDVSLDVRMQTIHTCVIDAQVIR